MTRLLFVLLPVIATTLAGICVVVALSTGYDTLRPILLAAAIGGIISVPVSWVIAQRLG